MNIVVDIWGGEDSQEHVAGFVREIDDGLALAKRELMAGFLVNLLPAEVGQSFEPDFDDRMVS